MPSSWPTCSPTSEGVEGPIGDTPASALDIPGYRSLWLTGGLWHVGRWVAVFGTAYRIDAETGDPLLVQLVGTVFMLPMFLGGPIAGIITDRFDRVRTVGRFLAFLVPLAGLMGLAIGVDRAPLGLFYLFVALVGVGNVIDMTSRRSMAFELAGPALLTNAAALETIGLQAGTMTGNLLGGALLQTLDSVALYVGLAALYLMARLVFGHAGRQLRPSVGADAGGGGDRARIVDDVRVGLGLLASHRVLAQFLVTTVVMNFCFYSFTPLVPHFAGELGVGPALAGLLAAAVGLGVTVGALVAARFRPGHRGLLHLVGSVGAMTMLIVFVNVSWYPAAFAALFLAGLTGSGFSTTQSAVVVSLVDETVRGRALGTLSMAIGALPFGMFSLGLLARAVGPRLAVTLVAAAGLVVLAGWHATHPRLRQL